MPTLTINGQPLDFEEGQTILQVALENGIEIPHYCYHPGLSIVANCRICLAEVWAPNPRNEGKLEPIPKLLPTCQQPAADGNVVYTDSEKAVANQKAVMEYLLLNHPIDCPVCDQAGECHLQDYSYQYGRGQVRFEEEKITQPKKDIGPHVLLYSDRCIMCTRCVRFTREVSGTGELLVEGRGAYEQIDVFPGKALDNEMSGNVIDLCPVGALLDKDFLFQQRVWRLTKTPSIDGLTCSGDNISVEHNEGRVYRIKPRFNAAVNRWWITDEVRYGWKFVHGEGRLRAAQVKGEDEFTEVEAGLAYETAYRKVGEGLGGAKRVGVLISPMLSCEDAFLLAKYALAVNGEVVFGVGPVPFEGEDKSFKDGFTMYAEKAPNARGVRRVLEGLSNGQVLEAEEFIKEVKGWGSGDAVLVTGNYPSDWVTADFAGALEGVFVVLIDTLGNRLSESADVVIPGASWMEKAGSFENVNGVVQGFGRAINPIDYCKGEGQIALDLDGVRRGEAPLGYDAAVVRAAMAGVAGLEGFRDVGCGEDVAGRVESDMEMVEL